VSHTPRAARDLWKTSMKSYYVYILTSVNRKVM
jgi:hypothetical protein